MNNNMNNNFMETADQLSNKLQKATVIYAPPGGLVVMNLLPKGTFIDGITKEIARIMGEMDHGGMAGDRAPGFLVKTLRVDTTYMLSRTFTRVITNRNHVGVDIEASIEWLNGIDDSYVSSMILFANFVKCDLLKSLGKENLSGDMLNLVADPETCIFTSLLMELVNINNNPADINEALQEIKLLHFMVMNDPTRWTENEQPLGFKTKHKRRSARVYQGKLNSLIHEIKEIQERHIPQPPEEPNSASTDSSGESRVREFITNLRRNPKSAGRNPYNVASAQDAEDNGLERINRSSGSSGSSGSTGISDSSGRTEPTRRRGAVREF